MPLMKRPLIIAGLLLALAGAVFGFEPAASSYHPAPRHAHHVTPRKHRVYRSTASAHPRGCKTCPRDAHGRIKRSPQARTQFLRQTGYPHGRPGYVVDHIVPLECGGADAPSNMQWQTAAAAKAKDRTEGNCRR